MSKHWKIILGFEGYEAHRRGLVRNGKTKKLLKPSPNGGAGKYLRVSVKNNQGVRKSLSLHSLILTAFVGPRPAGHHGCHLNDDKYNNHISNLLWALPQENKRHQRVNGGYVYGERHGRFKLTNKQIEVLRRSYKKYGDGNRLCIKYGLSYDYCMRILRGAARVCG